MAVQTPKARRGRPRLIPSPEEFSRRADGYFDACAAGGRPVLLTGLALALGLSGKQGIYDYAGYEGFADVVRRALLRVESAYEEALRGGGAASGPIFALKNFGWSDKNGLEQAGTSPAGRPGAADCEAMAREAAARLTELRRERLRK